MKRLAKMTAVVLALIVLAPVLPQASAETEGPPTTVSVHGASAVPAGFGMY